MNKCIKCGSTKVFRADRLLANCVGGDGFVYAVAYSKPEALLGRGEVRSPLQANICSSCHHVELSIANPKALYAVVQKRAGGVPDEETD
jgi:hypothetical protein